MSSSLSQVLSVGVWTEQEENDQLQLQQGEGKVRS